MFGALCTLWKLSLPFPIQYYIEGSLFWSTMLFFRNDCNFCTKRCQQLVTEQKFFGMFWASFPSSSRKKFYRFPPKWFQHLEIGFTDKFNEMHQFFFSWTSKLNESQMKRWKYQSKWINKWWSYGLLHIIVMNFMSAPE